MKIDSHHHLWTLSRGDYGWMSPALGPIYRDFEPADLEPHLQAAGIDKTIIVQAADTVAETEFMLATADATDWIAGVVGWVDMESETAIQDLERLAASPLLKGIRPMIQEIADPDWVLLPSLDRVFDALVDMGLRFDALVLPMHLPQLLSRLETHPDLACVINHGAKPKLSTGDLETWRQNITRIAENTGSFCKLSGLVTEAGEGYTIDTIRPAADHILATFKPERVMFGSDWPVLNLAGTYSDWVGMVEDLTCPLSEAARASIFGDTAASFYGI
ncbi:MAG: amidohydrolase family protein [Pseudomonadota bacterium]